MNAGLQDQKKMLHAERAAALSLPTGSKWMDVRNRMWRERLATRTFLEHLLCDGKRDNRILK